MKKLLMTAALAAVALGLGATASLAEKYKACWVYVGPVGDGGPSTNVSPIVGYAPLCDEDGSRCLHGGAAARSGAPCPARGSVNSGFAMSGPVGHTAMQLPQ